MTPVQLLEYPGVARGVQYRTPLNSIPIYSTLQLFLKHRAIVFTFSLGNRNLLLFLKLRHERLSAFFPLKRLLTIGGGIFLCVLRNNF